MSCKLEQIQYLIRDIKLGKNTEVSMIAAVAARDAYIKGIQIQKHMISRDGSINNTMAAKMLLESDPGYVALRESYEAAKGKADSQFEKLGNFMVKKADGSIKYGKRVLEAAELFLHNAKETKLQLESEHTALAASFTKYTNKPIRDSGIEGMLKDELRSTKRKIDKLATQIEGASSKKKTASSNLTQKANIAEGAEVALEVANAAKKALEGYAETTALGYKTISNVPRNMQKSLGRLSLSSYFKVKPVGNALTRIAGLLTYGYTTAVDALTLTTEEAALKEQSRGVMNATIAAINKTVKNNIKHDVVTVIDVARPATGMGFQNISQLLYKEVDNVTTSPGKTDFRKNSDYTRELPAEVVTAMALALNDWLANTTTWDKRTNDEINKFLGNSPGTTVTPVIRAKLVGIDVFMTTGAQSIGEVVTQTLGITADTEKHLMSKELLGKLQVELGLIALQSAALDSNPMVVIKGVKANVIYGDKAAKDAKGNVITIQVIELTEGFKAALGDNAKSMSKDIGAATKLFGIESRRKKPRMFANPREKEFKNKSKQSTWFTTAPITVNALNRAENVPWKWNEAYMLDISYSVENEREALQEFLGYVDPTTVHKVYREGVISKNAAIEKELDDMMEVYEEMQRDGNEELFLNYFFGKNGRFYIDSNTINPQGYKTQRGAINTPTQAIATEVEAIMQDLAFAQAFGVDIDKLTISEALRQWVKIEAQLVKSNLQDVSMVEALELLTDGSIKGVNGKPVGASWHQMMGISNYRAYAAYKASNNGSIIGMESLMPLEIDGVTNGYIFKSLQMPLHSDVETHLQSGGVMVGERVSSKPTDIGAGEFVADAEGTGGVLFKYKSFGAQAMDENTKDNYQMPADTMGEILPQLLNEPFYKGNELVNRVTELALGGYLGMANKPKDLPIIARAFMKEPFMVFNYGAGITKIIDTLVYGSVAKGAMDRFYDLVIESNISDDAKMSKEEFKKLSEGRKANEAQIVAIIKSASYGLVKGKDGWSMDPAMDVSQYLIDKTVTEFLEMPFEDRLNFIIPKAIENNIASGVKAGLGEALETAFAEYSDYIDAGETINKSFSLMFKMFQAKLDVRVEAAKKALGSDVLTDDEMDTLIDALTESMPAIKTALAEGDSDRLLIYKEATANYEEVKGESYFSGDAKLKLSELDSKGVSKVRRAKAKRRMLIDSFASGSVIPIHFLDGSAMSKTLETTDSLGVHDALFVLPHAAVSTANTYNKFVADVTESYSLTIEVLDSLIQSMNNATQEEVTAINNEFAKLVRAPKKADSVASIYAAMVDLSNKAENARVELLSKPIRYEQMALEGSHYDWNMEGKAYVAKKPTTTLEIAGKEFAKFDKIEVDAVNAGEPVTMTDTIKANVVPKELKDLIAQYPETIKKTLRSLFKKAECKRTYKQFSDWIKKTYPVVADTVPTVKTETPTEKEVRTNKVTNPIINAPVKASVRNSQHFAKDIAMGEIATQFIGEKAGNAAESSTEVYKEAWGDKANSGIYTSDDIIMVSGSGPWRGVTHTQINTKFKEFYKAKLDVAIAAGAKMVVGNAVGIDKLVVQYLKDNGVTVVFDNKVNFNKADTSKIKTGTSPELEKNREDSILANAKDRGETLGSRAKQSYKSAITTASESAILTEPIIVDGVSSKFIGAAVQKLANSLISNKCNK